MRETILGLPTVQVGQLDMNQLGKVTESTQGRF